MIESKTISAVLFVYNQEKYLDVMLDSVLAQTVTVDAIIIVDDFSTDNTAGIISRYANQFSHIKPVVSKKKGKVHAYATGLEHVATDLFFVGAGDDYLLPNYVEHLYSEVLKAQNVLYCYARFYVADSALQNRYTVETKPFYTKRELLQVNHTSGYLFGHSSIINDIIPLPENLLFEDWFTSIRLAHVHGKNYVSTEPVFLYRKHDQGATNVSGKRDKYFYSFRRDLVLYESVMKAGLLITPEEKAFVRSRIKALKTKLEYAFGAAFLLLFDRYLPWKEKIKILFFPMFLSMKYKK